MKAVHQYFPTFEPGAIGDHGLKVQRFLREQGYESEIFAEFSKGGFENGAHVHSDYGKTVRARDDDVLMYHMAIGSNVADWLNDVPRQRLVLAHHNITPVDYYEPWAPDVTYGMAWGRSQLEKLAKRASLGAAMSEYNRRELEALHYKRTALTPLLIDFAMFDHDIDPTTAAQIEARKAAGETVWCFVGWIAPHKCQHDLIRALAAYRRLYGKAHLYLVGRPALDNYQEACEKLAAELGIADSVTFTGRVSDGELGAYYGHSDVLVSMSEHEGVGIPLLEAMHNRLPVVAHASAAVPETIKGAGLSLNTKKPAVVAASVARVTGDARVREAMVEAGIARAQEMSMDRAKAMLLDALQSLDAGDRKDDR